MKEFLKQYSLYMAWVIALVAMAGSLYFSNVRGFAPCVLCWYQRIAMYPMVFLIPVGILKKDKNLPLYVLPLATTGILVALYHNLLYFGILPKSASHCLSGVSCTTQFIHYFGFVTIPLLSFIALTAVALLVIAYRKLNYD